MIHTTAPIARWARVPNETLSGTQQIGVVAFHKDGIKEVRYMVNGIDGQTITDTTFNRLTKIEEFSFEFDFDTTKDGEITTFSATVVANDDSVTELSAPFTGALAKEGLFALPLQKSWTAKTYYVSQTGSDLDDGSIAKPFASYGKAISKVLTGDTILFSDGEHAIGQPATQSGFGKPGIGKWVIIRGGNNTVFHNNSKTLRLPCRIKFDSITWDLGRSGYIANADAWWHNCKFVSPSNHAWWEEAVRIHGEPSVDFTVNTKGSCAVVFRETLVSSHYFTDCSLEHYESGFANTPMVRNSTIRRIWGDALKQTKGVFNVDVSEQYGWMSDVHTDLYQTWMNNNNIIVCGLNAHGLESVQGIFCRMVDTTTLDEPYVLGESVQNMLSNAAFINCTIEHTPKARGAIKNWGGPPWTQFRNKFNHVLIQNMRLTNQRIFFGGTLEEGWEHSDHQDFIIRDSDLHWSFIEDLKSTRSTAKWTPIEGGYKHKLEGIVVLGCHNSVPKG